MVLKYLVDAPGYFVSLNLYTVCLCKFQRGAPHRRRTLSSYIGGESGASSSAGALVPWPESIPQSRDVTRSSASHWRSVNSSYYLLKVHEWVIANCDIWPDDGWDNRKISRRNQCEVRSVSWCAKNASASSAVRRRHRQQRETPVDSRMLLHSCAKLS